MKNNNAIKYAITILRKNELNQDEALITVIVQAPFTNSGILDYYAKEYGFEREKLSCGIMTHILDFTDMCLC